MSIELDYDIGEDVAYVDGERYVRERTCHKKWHKSGYGFCSECGANVTSACDRYCWQCGRRIVEEDE